MSKQMTREELVEILTADGTMSQIEEALAAKELGDEEKARIFDYFQEEDRAKADSLFKEILADIESRPVFETAKEERADWKQIRVGLANEIKQLRNAEFECREKINDLREEIDRIDQKYASASNEAKQYAEAYKEKLVGALEQSLEDLSVKTKQHGALALMHAEARTMESQARAKMFVEVTQPYRDTLKHSWDSLSERIHTAYMHTKNLHNAKSRTNDLDFHPIKNTINKIQLSHAKSQVKEVNYIKAKIEKEEKKLLEQANKISKKEYGRDQRLNTLKSLSKGAVRTQGEGPEQIADVGRAKEVLQNSKLFSDKKLETMQATLNKLIAQKDAAEQKAYGALENIAKDLRERRETVQTMAYDIAEQIQNDEINANAKGLDVVEKNLMRGMDATFLSQASLTEDLNKFMQENGFADLIEGYQEQEQEFDFDR